MAGHTTRQPRLGERCCARGQWPRRCHELAPLERFKWHPSPRSQDLVQNSQIAKSLSARNHQTASRIAFDRLHENCLPAAWTRLRGPALPVQPANHYTISNVAARLPKGRSAPACRRTVSGLMSAPASCGHNAANAYGRLAASFCGFANSVIPRKIFIGFQIRPSGNAASHDRLDSAPQSPHGCSNGLDFYQKS